MDRLKVILARLKTRKYPEYIWVAKDYSLKDLITDLEFIVSDDLKELANKLEDHGQDNSL